jgi:hypothetical protein
VVVAVLLGTEAQADGLVQVVWVAAGKELTAQAQVRTEQQIQVVAVVLATPV